MKIIYPQIQDAQNIVGFVSKDHVKVDINVGQTLDLDDDTASQIMSTFPFLEKAEEIVEEVLTEQPIIDINPPLYDISQIERTDVSMDIDEVLRNLSFDDKKKLIKKANFKALHLSNQKADQIIKDNNLLS